MIESLEKEAQRIGTLRQLLIREAPIILLMRKLSVQKRCADNTNYQHRKKKNNVVTLSGVGVTNFVPEL